jgi:hypothetical protein
LIERGELSKINRLQCSLGHQEDHPRRCLRLENLDCL